MHSPPHSSPTPAAGRRVLLVDDDGAVRATVRRFLERAGLVVVEAAGGDDALATWDALDAAVDVLVTDARMPGMDGRALAARLRARRPALPVVVMSGHGDLDETPDAALDGGATGALANGGAANGGAAHGGAAAPWAFVAKPFSGRELVAVVRAALDGAALDGGAPDGAPPRG